MKRKKSRNKNRPSKKVAKLITASMAITPLIISAPAVMGAVQSETAPAVIGSIAEKLAGKDLKVGDSVTIGLEEIFQDFGGFDLLGFCSKRQRCECNDSGR